MKTILLLTVLLATIIARADNPPAPTPVPAPIRQAKMQAIVTKTWNQKQSDGSFKKMVETVCTLDAPISVYEIGSLEMPQPQLNNGPTCKTQLKVGPSTITIAGEILLIDNVNNPFKTGEVTKWKGFVGAFWVVNDKGDFFKIGSVGTNISEDMNQKSLILAMNSNGLTANGAGDQTIDESLSVLLRFED